MKGQNLCEEVSIDASDASDVEQRSTKVHDTLFTMRLSYFTLIDGHVARTSFVLARRKGERSEVAPARCIGTTNYGS